MTYPKRRRWRPTVSEPPAQVSRGEVLTGTVEPANPRSSEPMKVLCVATNRHGHPCGLPPIRGGTVCHKHGGSAPQVVRAARLRAQIASDTIMGRLVRIALESQDERAAIVAAKEVFDVAGVKGAQTEQANWERVLINVTSDDADQDMPDWRARRHSGYADRQEGFIEGEVVDDE